MTTTAKTISSIRENIDEVWEEAIFQIKKPDGKRTVAMIVMYVPNKYAMVSYEYHPTLQAFYSVKDKQWVSTFLMWDEMAIVVERLVTGKNATKRKIN